MTNTTDTISDKEFNTISKSIFYQLFNRKLSFVVFTGNKSLYNKWMFTNVDYETILVYDSNPDYFYSLVTLKNEKYLDKFYTLFPILKTTPCLIRVVDFLSTLSKAKSLNDCIIRKDRNNIVLSYTDKDNIVIEKIIGCCLLDIDVDMYYTLWKSGLITSEHPYLKSYLFTELQEIGGRSIVQVFDSNGEDNHNPRKVSAVVQLGYMVPNISMFLKNMSEQNQSFTISAGYDKDSIIVNGIYDTDLLSCITTQPAQRWFIMKHNSKNTQEV